MTDHIDLAGCKAKGIKVGHTPGVLSNAVADITVMLVLMTMRRVEEGIALIKSGGVSRPLPVFRALLWQRRNPDTTPLFRSRQRISMSLHHTLRVPPSGILANGRSGHLFPGPPLSCAAPPSPILPSASPSSASVGSLSPSSPVSSPSPPDPIPHR